jgi:tetratricopeptide (TPR) repeat protein
MNTSTHLGQEALAHLLWVAAPCPGASEAIVHLVEECSACYKPPRSHPPAGKVHFDEEVLEFFFDRLNQQASPELLDSFDHLVGHCPRCAAASETVRQRFRKALSKEWSGERFDALASGLSRRFLEWEERIPREKEEAVGLFRQLMDQPQARRLMLIRNSDRFLTWPVIDALCEASRNQTSGEPTTAVELAEAAVEVAQRIDGERYGVAIGADLLARAWAFLGNALRVANLLSAAEAAFFEAESQILKGTGLPSAKAEIVYLRSYLEAANSRYSEARAFLHQALVIYRELGDLHMQGRVRVIEAWTYNTEGNASEAIGCLREAALTIDVEREPKLLLVTRQNLIVALSDLGRFDEAEAVLTGCFELARSLGSRLDLLRLRWAEARIDTGLGRLHRAEATLVEIKEAFKALDLPYESALAGLELATLYAQHGRLRELKLLALEMLPVFAKNELYREALASVTLFAQAAAAEEVTVEIVQRTLSSLQELASSR